MPASCSRVVPNSWKWRIAIMAIQFAAEGVPYGSTHCMNPPMRTPPRLRPPPPPVEKPGITAERPASPCAEASVTVRKHRTWRASPVVTAMAALTTEPSCPGDSMPPMYQSRSRRSASCSSVTPTPLNPGGVSMAPGYVAMPSMSAVVSPASAMASRQASRVRSSPERYRRRPTSDWPMPDTTASRRCLLIGRRRELEERQPDVVVLLEGHAQRHPDPHCVGRHADDASGDAEAGLLG